MIDDTESRMPADCNSVAVHARTDAPRRRAATAPIPDADPFGHDVSSDPPVVTTERRLRRLAAVACGVGHRLSQQDEGDAYERMLERHASFGGERALDACQNREAFLRANVLNALALDFDIDPEEVDALTSTWHSVAEDTAAARPPIEEGAVPLGTLFTCWLEGPVGSDGLRLQAFCAMVATDEREVRARLRARYGEDLSATASVVVGLEGQSGVVELLLAPAVMRMLAASARDVGAPEHAGLDLHFEQRYRP